MIYLKRIIPVIGISALVISAIFLTTKYINLSDVLKKIETLKEFANKHFIFSICLYTFALMLFVSLYIPGSTIIMALAGVLFGPLLGTLLVVSSSTLGAYIVFLFSEKFLTDFVKNKFNKKYESFKKEMEENGTPYLLAIRSIPIFPLFLVNLFSGSSGVKFKTFAWTTPLGLIPISAIYVYLGYTGALSIEKEGLSLPPQFFIALTLLALVIVLPVIFKKMLKKKESA